MKKLVANLSIILVVFLGLSCSEKDCCSDLEKEGSGELGGEWLLAERGYSPGAGYVVEPVSAIPPQLIVFKSNGELSSSVTGLTDFKFYSVMGDVVGFFKADPGPSPDSLAFTHSYNFSFEDGKLKLGFRYCYEGCHLGFKKVE